MGCVWFIARERHCRRWGETLRFAGLPLDIAEVDIATFDQVLSEAYQQNSSAAMQMVEGLGDDMDLASLAERLPETEDLLEQEDDAPIILINALLSEAVKENASDIHVETFEKTFGGALLHRRHSARDDPAAARVGRLAGVVDQGRCQARICREALSGCRYSYVAGVVGGIRKRELFQIYSEE